MTRFKLTDNKRATSPSRRIISWMIAIFGAVAMTFGGVMAANAADDGLEDAIVAPAPIQNGAEVIFTNTSEYEYYNILTAQTLTSPYVLTYGGSAIHIDVRPLGDRPVVGGPWGFIWPLDETGSGDGGSDGGNTDGSGDDSGDGDGGSDGGNTDGSGDDSGDGDGGSDGGNTDGSGDGSTGGTDVENGVGGNTDGSGDGSTGGTGAENGVDGNIDANNSDTPKRDAGKFDTGDTVLAGQSSAVTKGSPIGMIAGASVVGISLTTIAGVFAWKARRRTQPSQG